MIIKMDNRNEFLFACQHIQNVNVIKYLVDDLKMDINSKDKDDDNGFTLACL